MTRITRRHLLGMAGGAAALGLVGCGGDDDDSGDSSETPAAAGTTPAGSTPGTTSVYPG